MPTNATEPQHEKVLDIEGPEGETIFWHSKGWLVKDRVDQIQEFMDEMWEHYREAGDDRLLAVIGALCVERAVNALLLGFAPAFEQYEGASQFTFSLKTKIIRSLSLLPARILAASDLIGKIRNEFAHHLEYKTFGDLDGGKLLRKLEPAVMTFDAYSLNESDHRKLFKDLVGFVILSLRVYGEQTSLLRRFLESQAGRENFKRWSESRTSTPSATEQR